MRDLFRAIAWEAIYHMSEISHLRSRSDFIDRGEYALHGSWAVTPESRLQCRCHDGVDAYGCREDIGPVPRLWRMLKYEDLVGDSEILIDWALRIIGWTEDGPHLVA